MFVLYVSGLIFLMVIGYFIYCYRKDRVSTEYICKEGNFTIKGRKNNFTIKKDNGLVFLVENGRITAVKNIKDKQNFVRYGG